MKKYWLIFAFSFTCLTGTLYAQSDADFEERSEIEANERDLDKDPPMDVVDEMPLYPKGQIELTKFIKENLKYPKKAAQNKIEGTVEVSFVVARSGEIKEVKILKSLDKDCDKEAIRVVKKMPKWQPGKHDGKNVSVRYVLPIIFDLSN